MTQAELGKAIGVTQGSVSFYELGKHPMPPALAARLIDVAKRRKHPITFDDVYGKAPAQGGRPQRATA